MMAPPPPPARLPVPQSPAHRATRSGILSSSAKGWSPLQITKRSADSVPSTPAKETGSARRSSNSFRHMATNSLVAKSPFKDIRTVQGAMSAGLDCSTSSKKDVIHERRNPNRALGQAPTAAAGSANTPKSAVGLGKSRSPPGSAVNGTCKVSNERKVSIPSTAERKAHMERKVSREENDENDNKGSITKKKKLPRQSMAYKALVKNEYVTHSPFLAERANNSADDSEFEDTEKSIQPSIGSPSPRRTSSGSRKRMASPSANLAQNRTSMSSTASPSKASPTTAQQMSPSKQQMSPSKQQMSPGKENFPARTPTKSSLVSRRMKGPRSAGSASPPARRKSVSFQPIPDVREFECPSTDVSYNTSVERTTVPDSDDWYDEETSWVGSIIKDEVDLEFRPIPQPQAPQPQQQVQSQDRSFDSMEEQPMGDVSATADFMDSLYEEGLFEGDSMEQDTPVVEQRATFEGQADSNDDSEGTADGPQLKTPLTANTPLPEQQIGFPSSPHHKQAIHPHPPPIEQPHLPHNEEHRMLLNADVSQPQIPSPRKESVPDAQGPHAHQVGAMYDPFISIQTATEFVGEAKERSEGGVPLGRTSHADRVHAARVLATQSLGLGFPGRSRSPTKSGSNSGASSPALSDGQATPVPQGTPKKGQTEEDVFGAVIASPAAARKPSPATRKSLDRKVSDVPELQGPSSRMAQFRAMKGSPTKRSLPKPPKSPAPAPQPIGLPSPVHDRAYSSASESEVEPASESEGEYRRDVEETQSKRLSDLPPPKLTLGEDLESALSPSPPPRLALSPELEEKSLQDITVDDEPYRPETPTHIPSSPYADSPLTPSQRFARRAVRDEEDDELFTPPRPHSEHRERESSPRIPSFEFEPSNLSIDVDVDSDSSVDGALHALGGMQITDGRDLMAGMESIDGMHSPSVRSSVCSTSSQGDYATPIGSVGDHEDSMDTTIPAIRPPTTPRSGSPAMARASSPATPTRAGSPQVSTPLRATPSRAHVASPLSAAPMMATAPLAAAGEFGPQVPPKDDAEVSTTTRIRQRISRDAIREQVNKRVAAGELSLNGRPTSVFQPQTAAEPSPVKLAARPNSASGTPVKLRSKKSLSNIATAASSKMDSPKSALDRIAGVFKGDESTETSPAPPVSPPLSPPRSQSVAATTRPAEPTLPRSAVGSIVDDPKALAAARKSRRRSNSTGDIGSVNKRAPRVTLGLDDDAVSILDSFRDETFDDSVSEKHYRIREERRQVRATYTGSGSLSSRSGDTDSIKAWRPIRRPSDMHEHSIELRAAREREAREGKASGTVFVKVLGIESLSMPLPKEPTYFRIAVDNNLDYIRTDRFFELKEGAKINQEFVMAESENFEFSIAMEIRADPHILRLMHEKANPPTAPVPAPAPAPVARPVTPTSTTSHKSRGLRALFGGTPKKNKHQRTQSVPVTTSAAFKKPVQPAPPVKRPDTIATFFAPGGDTTLAKTHIAFKPIAEQCEAKVLEIRYPMFAMVKPAPLPDGTAPRKQLAKITIQVLRLPPLPGLGPDNLPGSIDETLRGLRHHKWHSQVYHEGILTQVGGDCRVPRRRFFKLIGGSLVAINEVTKKEVARIDLREASALVDCNQPGVEDDYDPFSARPRSFQLRFTDNEAIVFSADKDDDKAVWMDTLQGLLGKVPSNPIWAEMLAQSSKERKDRRRSKRRSSAMPPPASTSSRTAGRKSQVPTVHE